MQTELEPGSWIHRVSRTSGQGSQICRHYSMPNNCLLQSMTDLLKFLCNKMSCPKVSRRIRNNSYLGYKQFFNNKSSYGIKQIKIKIHELFCLLPFTPIILLSSSTSSSTSSPTASPPSSSTTPSTSSSTMSAIIAMRRCGLCFEFTGTVAAGMDPQGVQVIHEFEPSAFLCDICGI